MPYLLKIKYRASVVRLVGMWQGEERRIEF